MRIVAGLPHAPRGARPACLERVLARVGSIEVGIFDKWAPSWAWADHLHVSVLARAKGDGATHCLFLTDDSLLSPRFEEILNAMLEAVPDQMIGLHAVHARGPEIAANGGRWYTTHAWLVGVGYVLPTQLLEAFLYWRENAAHGFVKKFGDDSIINEWCGHTSRNVWHPVPTIVQHDLETPSVTRAQFGEPHRASTVTWEGYDLDQLVSPEFWRPGHVPHLLMPHQGG